MATPRKKKTSTVKKSTNGGRATIRDVMTAVQGLHTRIDGNSERIDASLAGQQGLSKQMSSLHDKMHDLRDVTNDRLHAMETDIITYRRPWALLAQGWQKVMAFSGVAAAVSGIIVRFELWRIFPGL